VRPEVPSEDSVKEGEPGMKRGRDRWGLDDFRRPWDLPDVSKGDAVLTAAVERDPDGLAIAAGPVRALGLDKCETLLPRARTYELVQGREFGPPKQGPSANWATVVELD
jgi:hypothetical protein